MRSAMVAHAENCVCAGLEHAKEMTSLGSDCNVISLALNAAKVCTSTENVLKHGIVCFNETWRKALHAENVIVVISSHFQEIAGAFGSSNRTCDEGF